MYKFLPTLLTSVKILHRTGATPVFLTVTDISPGAGLYTDTTPALYYLRSRRVNLVYRLPGLVRVVDKLARYLYDMNIEESEQQPPGEYNLAGVNLGAMLDTSALQNVFFYNPSFGVKRSNNQMFRDIGCNYCFWTIHFRNRHQILGDSYSNRISTNTNNNLRQAVDSNLVCLFKNRWSECPREIIRIKKKMENYLERRDLPYSKYINWPSCDSEDWMWRYWGANYNTLLHIKVRLSVSPVISVTVMVQSDVLITSLQDYWDPGNVFNHCQSVGSLDNECCPFTLSRPQGPPKRNTALNDQKYKQ